MVAITRIGAPTTTVNGLVGATSLTLGKPAGTANGDLIIAVISIGNLGAITPPAGWSQLSVGTTNDGTFQTHFYTKIASGEPASWSWSWVGTASFAATGLTYRNVLSISGQQKLDGLALLAHTDPVTTVVVNNSVIVSAYSARSLLSLGWAADATETEMTDIIGGLLILLNVNHMTAETGLLAPGNYQHTALTLVAIAALDAALLLTALDQHIDPSSIPSGEAWGTPKINLVIKPSSIPPGEAWGTPRIRMSINPFSIPSGEAWGIPTIDLVIRPDSIPSEETWGTPSLLGQIYPVSIPSEEAWGIPTIQLNQYIYPDSIFDPDTLNIDPPLILAFTQFIFPDSILSMQTFGIPLISKLVFTLAPCQTDVAQPC